MNENDVKLSDFIQPLIIEKAEDFNPRAAKALFERTCKMLSRQAFWLAIFEYLEKHGDAVSAVQFEVDSFGSPGMGVARAMKPVEREGADTEKRAKAYKASDGAFAKARGKVPSLDVRGLYFLARECLPASGLATLEGREEILKKALGSQLYALRLSSIERKELDGDTANSVAAALSGRKANRL